MNLMTAELALMRILKLMWVWETCQLLQVVIVCGVESMSCHTMNKVTSLDVDWEVMKEKAMNCLISMGVTYENISLNFGFARDQDDPPRSMVSRRTMGSEHKSHQGSFPNSNPCLIPRTGAPRQGILPR